MFKIVEELKKVNVYSFFAIVLLTVFLWYGYLIRLKTANTDIPLDYDPWFFYRYAKNILEKKVKWDELSYFPPGRPYYINGYSFTIAFFYKLLSNFINISLEKFCVYFVVFYTLAASFLAFILSYYLTRNLLFSAISCAIIIFSPSFVSVSMAGYVDSDVVYVFFTYLCVISTLIFLNRIEKIKKFDIKEIIKIFPYSIFAIISYILFAWNWNSAYYISNIFLASLFLYYCYNVAIEYFKTKKLNLKNQKLYLFFSFLILLSIIQIISIVIEKMFYPIIFLPKPFDTFISQLDLLIKGGLTRAMLVNISVAELQKIGIFSPEVIARVGSLPFFISIIGMSILIFERIVIEKQVSISEFFLIVWFILSLYLISQGVRFGLLFSTSLAVFTSYSLNFIYNLIKDLRVNLPKKIKKYENYIEFLEYVFITAILSSLFLYINSANDIANGMKGMEINENWRNALDFLKRNGNETTLVATWWDPGHIIAGYTGLKVHADGAHCDWNDCIPYNHDIRIQDMGRILSTSNETEAYELLKKYTYISEEDCKKVKNAFPFFNESICKIKIDKIYFIASHDLIFKFYWPYYFSSCIRKNYPYTEICYTKEGIDEFFYKKNLAEGKFFITFALDTREISENRLKYISYQRLGNQLIEIPLYVIIKNNTFIAFLRNQPLKSIVINGIEYFAKNAGYNDYLDYVAFADPYAIVGNVPYYIYLADNELANSMFAKMFFLNGKDLKFFKLVFNNPEIKIYEVDF
jgi:asparagine N-glycosylation enzyme membrane subunit Stt3